MTGSVHSAKLLLNVRWLLQKISDQVVFCKRSPKCDGFLLFTRADESYKAAGLPEKIPIVALIHPKNPDVVYFFLEEHLFGVDMRARKVVECQVYGLVAPPSIRLASRFVRAWELPRALSSSGKCFAAHHLLTFALLNYLLLVFTIVTCVASKILYLFSD